MWKIPQATCRHPGSNRKTPFRRQILTGAGAVAAPLGSWPAGGGRSTSQTEASQAVLDALRMIEALAVTLVGVARQMEEAGSLDLGSELSQFLTAMQCADEAHGPFWQDAGATANTETAFSVPPTAMADQGALLAALIELKELTISAYMAASRHLATNRQERVVEVAFQIGAVEGQHLALLRQAAGMQLPADRAFARWRFAALSDAVPALIHAGYLGGSGERVSYPGPVDRVCRGVTGLVPDTTDDPPVTPIPPATPVATPAGEATPNAEA